MFDPRRISVNEHKMDILFKSVLLAYVLSLIDALDVTIKIKTYTIDYSFRGKAYSITSLEKNLILMNGSPPEIHHNMQ